MMKLIHKMQIFWRTPEIQSKIPGFAWLISIFITLYCLFLLSAPLYITSAPKGVVFATDNDGGRAIETSMATRWYNSNHFAPYGNFYYRLSHSLADLIKIPDENLSPTERTERTHDFALKIVSLLSLYALSLFIVYLFLGMSPETLLLSNVLILLSLKSSMWSLWVFRPHPEHLLSLFTALAFYFFARFIVNSDDKKKFVISALLWGLAMAVKRSTAMYLPGIILLMAFPFNRNNFIKASKYIGFMLLSYLLIGFPQNFGFVKHIKFLLYESSIHTVGGIETILTGLEHIWGQIYFILPFLLFLSFFSVKKEKILSWKLLFFLILSSLPILLRKLSYNGDHHTMPIAVSVLIFAVIAVEHLQSFIFPKARFLILFVGGLISLKFIGVPTAYTDTFNSQMACRNEINEVNNLTLSKISPDFTLLREPFFPSNEKIIINSKASWGIRYSEITNNVGLIGVQQGSIADHQAEQPSSFYGKRSEHWEDKRKFYQLIKNQTEVNIESGSFVKIYSSCGFDLWARK